MTQPIAYLNGSMIPAAQAQLPIIDQGIVFGATVTEQTRTFRHQPWRLEAHLERLFRGLTATGIDIGMTPPRMAELSREVVQRNARLISPGDDLGLIQFVTAGEFAGYAGTMGRPARASPTVCIHTFPLPFQRWANSMRHGARLVIPAIRHVPRACLDPAIKCRSRMHWHLANLEARAVEPEATALLLDLEGHITETSAANFLMVQDGTLVSPTTANILPGFSRAQVIELAAKMNIPFTERNLTPAEVLIADEALLTSTPTCILPVATINGNNIGGGQPGPIFRRLLAAWSEMVGLDIGQQILGGSG